MKRQSKDAQHLYDFDKPIRQMTCQYRPFSEPLFTEDDLIYAYTRAQAIEDGVLVDVSETAREAGFRWPVALTAEVWGLIENIPPRFEGIQDVEGRLWDVLWMAKMATRRGGLETHYKLILHHGRKTYAALRWSLALATIWSPSSPS